MQKKPRVVLFVQARMGSTRLPGKHLKLILGRPVLSYLIERLRRTKLVDEIVLATTTNPLDDQLVNFCKTENLAYFRGPEEDVLERFLQGAKKFDADVIVRISGDCPLIDPQVVDSVIDRFLHSVPPYDYVANTLNRTFPRGMDAEVFSRQSLEKLALKATQPEEREHVTPYYYQHPEMFKLGSVERKHNDSHHRWTVDTEDDFTLIRTVLEEIYPKNPEASLDDLLALFNKHPEWLEINAHIKQKPLKG